MSKWGYQINQKSKVKVSGVVGRFGEMVESPSGSNGGKFVYKVTSPTGGVRYGYGDTASDAVCNCEWSV